MADEARGSVRNPISVAGAFIVTMSALVFLVVFLLDMFGLHSNPYMGIVFFIIVPSAFILGLLLIPLGMWIERRRIATGRSARIGWPTLDLNSPRQRRITFVVLVLTMANIVIVSLAAYKGIEFMDSPSFCGQVCHEVMQPEFTAYQNGPHSRVACVQCHIGPGAPWFVKAKLDGTRQVVAVLLNSHARPISSPVYNLRPAREVCEQCHWPEKFHGDKMLVTKEYAEDEANTEGVTTIRLHVGGGGDKIGRAFGIHWHMSPLVEVDYIATDDKRQVISYVKVKDDKGEVREYFVDGVSQAQLDAGEKRRMDCMDCHNRPSHKFDASAERAIDEPLSNFEFARTLPFVRREAVAALKVNYPDQVTAQQEIATRLVSFYKSNGNDIYATRKADVDRVVEGVQRIYGRNIFPSMKVTWGSYPNNIGHMDSPGCFRCHDDNHKTKDGRVIKQDCETCHEMQ
jgi:hypothetical protein